MLFEKLTFLTPWYARVRTQEAKNGRLLESFVYILFD